MNEEKIRKRKSYILFKELKEIVEKGNVKDTMNGIFSLIEKYKGFGYQTQANYAKESLELLLTEKEIV